MMANKFNLAGKAFAVPGSLEAENGRAAERLRHQVGERAGEFVWHKHDDTDDFFLVLEGRLEVRLRDRKADLGPGELFVVPRGIEHQTLVQEEARLLLIEPTATPNTGDRQTAAPRQEH